MAIEYIHTQRGYVTAGATGAGALLVAARMVMATSKLPLMALATLLGGAGVIFSSLTIEIRDGRLESYFGPGLPAKTVDLADIDSVEAVQNPWYYGWGIRYTPHGWLYNVSGYDAVEIRLKDGSQFRLGTDEPERLREAILRAQQRVT